MKGNIGIRNIGVRKYAATEPSASTQGKTVEEAIENIKEAVGLYLEEVSGMRKELKHMKPVGAISVEIA